MRHILRSYQSGARKRRHEWSLSEGAFVRLTSSDCFYCGSPPAKTFRTGKNNGEFVYNGIDRIDNSRGYVTGNVVACCWICNQAKKDMSAQAFMEWIARVAAYRIVQGSKYQSVFEEDE